MHYTKHLIKLAAKKKPKGTATKRDPKKWAAAKSRAKAKMGGKWSARAAQLAVKYYKDAGGKYKGKKPTAKNNKLKKWTKQDWQWSGDRKKKSSVNDSLVEALIEFSKEAEKKGKGVYLPAKAIDALKSSKKGRKKLRAASRKKTEATRKGEQHASHGLHRGKKRSKLGEEKRYRPKVQALLYDDLGSILASKSQAEGSGLRAYPNYKFPGGGIEPGESLVEAARKELLEEAGYEPASDPEDFGYTPTKVDWDEAFRQQALAKGRDFHGEEQFYMTAPAGKKVDTLLGSEGDQMTGLEFVSMSNLRKALEESSQDPSNEYGYFDEEKLKVLAKLQEYLSNKGVKTSSYKSPYMQAYEIGVKLAMAEFDDYSNMQDPDGYDAEELKADVEDPKDFRSKRYREAQTPATNNYADPKAKSNFASQPPEVTPDQTFGTNYPKRDRLRGKYNG